MADAPPVKQSADPQQPLGHLSRLGSVLVVASGIDQIAASLLSGLAALPAVRRVGFALAEGGGRRLRFTSSDRLADGVVDWCHIDAYDDVPLTRVVRTGEPVMGDLGSLDERYPEFVAGQPDEVRALAAVPLPGNGSPIGGLVVYLDEEWPFDDAQRGLLEATARRAADAVHRIRAGDETTDEPDTDEPDTRADRIVLNSDPRAAGEARRFLRSFLAHADVPEELVATAELCVSELVTNAIVHTAGRIEVRAILDDHLTVAVRDRGRALADPAPVDDTDLLRVHGRGLQLVDALVDRWGSDNDAAGSTVWFALAVS
ncbi:MAG TPA: ATP-binding protein [Nocardioides sp.]|uniref:ATP-binding protein n=1 Tax=Nocardioides sp. TaxID=35761 RepID=UPI002E360E24|nr:ATP-binding protein [Nocardioides sp.]HEX5088821.1 ATP-binding protein [Nocardioides sp.]